MRRNQKKVRNAAQSEKGEECGAIRKKVRKAVQPEKGEECGATRKR